MHETRRGVNWGKITIYFTYNDYNLYYYPVIGASACPESEPDCAPDEEGPVYVEFTGPTDTSNDYNAGFESWYQPVQEPFQLFSYPRTQAQLEASVGDVLTPVTDVKTFSTGNGISGTYSSNWTNEGTHTSSVASAAEQKQSVSVTVSAGTQDWSKLVGPGFRVSVTGSYAHSTSNRSIQLNTTKLGESSGWRCPEGC